MGAEEGKWWDRRSSLLFYSAVCHPPTLSACATVNIEIHYTQAFHHLLHTLKTCAALPGIEFLKKIIIVWGCCIRWFLGTRRCSDVTDGWWIITNYIIASNRLYKDKEQSIWFMFSVPIWCSRSMWRVFWIVYTSHDICNQWLLVLPIN